jgi:hypothetical protein
MSAQLKALTIQSGTSRRILDTSSLEVGLGINSAAGQDLTVKAANFGAGAGNFIQKVGTLADVTGGNASINISIGDMVVIPA